jgi:hypothetical protein
MKKLLCVALILIVGSFLACKKAEEDKPAEGKQVTNNKQIQKTKRNKRAKGVRPGLQIFQEEKLIVSIPRDQYDKITNTTIKVEGTDQKAILLTDLLKAHNLSGKFVILKGPNRTANLTWAEVTANPIYLYIKKNRFQTFHSSKALETAEIPVVVARVDVGDNPVPSETKMESAKKKKEPAASD